MLTSELILRFRQEVDDAELPGDGDDSDSLWKCEEILEYIDLAQKEFARKTKLLRDASTTSVTELTLTADDPWTTLSPRVIKIVRANLGSTGRKVEVKEFHEMDRGSYSDDYGIRTMSDWETAKGEPCILVTDMEKDRLRVVPIPTADDTVNLIVDRLPIDDIISTTSVLEITEIEHQRAMLEYMRHLAYLKQDADTYDKALSEEMFDKFIERVSVYSRERENVRNRVGTTGYGGIR